MVYLKSSTGKISAGSATIPIKPDTEHRQVKISIEKCPDKTANISYSLLMVFLKEEEIFE
jgi:hypothetical protein